MKRCIFLAVFTASLSIFVPAQGKSNDVISRQIRNVGGDKTFSITYDQDSKVSKLMAITENFSDGDTDKMGVQAMNFAAGFIYSGKSLVKAPESVLLTFWVLTKKNRFAAQHNLSVGNLDLGPARYVSKPRANMEYLNFDIKRDDVAKMASDPNAKVRLGQFEINFTRQQIRTLAELLELSDPSK